MILSARWTVISPPAPSKRRAGGLIVVFCYHIPMNGKTVLAVQGLIKDFNGLRAVDGIDFSIEAGECIGILGPNGAGKTTTIRMLYGITTPTAGLIEIFGLPFDKISQREIKNRMGIMPQELNLDTELSVKENLSIYARYFALPRSTAESRIDELLGFLKLEEKSSTSIDSLSGGMKRRLMLARALINEPELLILDEPTTGLDPQARHAIWKRLIELKSKGLTQILTTHYMDEAETICDRVIIMDHGKVLVSGSPRNLIMDRLGTDLVEISAGAEIDQDVLPQDPNIEVYGRSIYMTGYDLNEARKLVEQAGIEIIDLRLRRTTLEDLFLRLTGRRLRD